MAIHVNQPTASITTSTTTARTAYPASSLNGVLVLNVGTTVAHVASGDVTVTATVTNNAVQPNWPRVFLRKPEDTHLAAILDSGTGTVYFTPCSADEEV